MRDEEISTFLGQVTNHGLMCLFVLWAKPRPAMVNEIATITGLQRNQISGALNRLKLHGYAAEVGGGRWPHWTLTDRGRQLVLPGLTALTALTGEVMPHRSASLSTTTTALLSPSEIIKAVAVEAESDALLECITPSPKVEGVEGKPSEIGFSDLTRPATNPPAIDAKLAAAFKSAGIGSNAWPGLAKLEHITPALVKAHDAYRRERGESTGMLITRLRCGDPVPEKKRKPVRDGRDVAAEWQKVIDEQRGGQRRKG